MLSVQDVSSVRRHSAPSQSPFAETSNTAAAEWRPSFLSSSEESGAAAVLPAIMNLGAVISKASAYDGSLDSPPASPSFVPFHCIVYDDDDNEEEQQSPKSEGENGVEWGTVVPGNPAVPKIVVDNTTPSNAKNPPPSHLLNSRAHGLHRKSTVFSVVNGKVRGVTFVDKGHREDEEEDAAPPTDEGQINLIRRSTARVDKTLPRAPHPTHEASSDEVRVPDLDDIYPIPNKSDMSLSSVPTFQRLSMKRRGVKTDVFRETLADLRMEVKIARNSAAKVEATFRLATFCIESCGDLLDPYERSDVKLEGIRYLLRLSHHGVKEAQYYLGKAYAEDGQYDNAYAMFQLAAASGEHPAACYAMGTCLEHGKGCHVDEARAIHFYSAAAAAGHCLAMFRYAVALLKGEFGLTVNRIEAVNILRGAVLVADRQSPFAHFQLAVILENGLPQEIPADPEEAFKLLSQAALAFNYGPALARLAWAYENGSQLVKGSVDPERAVRLYRRGAVEGDDADCQHALSDWYLRGLEPALERNVEQAFYWAEKAAAKGHAGSQFALGYFFENGIGTLANMETAMDWYRLAASNGNLMAQHKLIDASSQAPPVVKASKKVVNLRRRRKNEDPGKCIIS